MAASTKTSPLRELLGLARIATFRAPPPQYVQGRDLTILLLGLLLLAAWVGVEPLLKSRALSFAPQALPHLAWIAAGALALAWLLSRLSRPEPDYRLTLLLTLGALPLAMVGSLASEKLVGNALYLLLAALGVYALLYFGVGLRAFTGRQQWQAVAAGAVATVAFVLGNAYLNVDPGVWVRADENPNAVDGAGNEWSRMAGVQFGQQSRIDADIARVAAHATPEPEAFFVGFAGYGGQQVFAREIELAGKVLGDRYALGQRSLLLVNDASNLEKWPLASEPALRHALRRLGEVMDDDDILFLSLSSHGDREAALKLNNAGVVPAKLTPESLAQMLREAGISWRVIVVSACYAGSFVDALADDRSIVIAAAASDRKSFGCDDKRQLTYFGEAFYRDALPAAETWQAAFTAARSELEAKEQRLDITPSLPQASFGKLMQERLEKWGQRRTVNTTPAPPPH